MSGILLGLGHGQAHHCVIALFGGAVIGLIVGSFGLNDSITMAVLIPITFGMEPQVAIVILVGILCICLRRRFRSVHSVKDSGHCAPLR